MKMRDSRGLEKFLGMLSQDANSAAADFLLNGGGLQTPKLEELGEDWAVLPDLVKCRLAASNALSAANFAEACTYLSQAMSIYLNIVSKEDAWTLPLLHDWCKNLRVLAEEADNQLLMDGTKVSKMEEVERLLKRAFMVTNNDRREIEDMSRRIGTLGIINQLLKVYFKLNNLRLCNIVTRAVGAPNFPDFETTFSVADRVTYKYFSGRLHLYDDRIPEAVEALQYAFDRTPKENELQKRLELLYLVPAKILMGYLPPTEILDKYNMYCYKDIVLALRTGNLGLFDRAVQKHQEFFIGNALYLVLENIRPLVYRALCRLVFRSTNSHKIKVDLMVSCLKRSGVLMERAEVECILANLIFNNYIKGYIAHKAGYLVLSKKDPFPVFHHQV